MPIEIDLEQVRRKLGDEKFIARAPAEIIEKEKRRLVEGEERAVKLRASLARLSSL